MHSGKYIPSRLEKQMMEVSRSVLHYDKDMVDECDLYRNASKKEFYEEYRHYVDRLDRYTKATKKFRSDAKDLRLLPNRTELCGRMDEVLYGSFDAEQHCSWTDAGYVEPLLPPMRHPRFCEEGMASSHLLNIDYLVHDFGTICRRLNPGARTVFFDIGASLEFHEETGHNPALSLIKLYNQFGVQFDHYYAFEYTVIPPDRVFATIPEELIPAYHWYNVGVESSPASRQNPWKSILATLNPSDLVVIKLDIDKSEVEIPLVYELLQNKYAPLVDHFYFEHHVRMKAMYRKWTKSARGTLKDSLDLFTGLREVGIGAHSWV